MTDIEIDDRLERILWRSIGVKSVRQVAQDTGLTVEQVSRIRTQLVDGLDDISIDQKRMKLLVDLQEIADKARKDYDSADDTDSGSKLLTASIGAIKTVLQELARIEKASSTAVDSLNLLRVRELVSLVQEAVDASVPEISEKYGIDSDDLFMIFNANLGKAAMKREIGA